MSFLSRKANRYLELIFLSHFDVVFVNFKKVEAVCLETQSEGFGIVQPFNNAITGKGKVSNCQHV